MLLSNITSFEALEKATEPSQNGEQKACILSKAPGAMVLISAEEVEQQ